MTTTERDWTRDDPYAGQKLPAPPAWLPGAAEAIYAAVDSAEEQTPRGDAEVASAVAAEPAAPAPDLTKRQPQAQAAAEVPVPPSPEEMDSEDDEESWEYVPLNIANAEAVSDPQRDPQREPLGDPLREPHYVNPEIIEPPVTAAEPFDTAPGLPGQHWFDEGPKDRPWHLIAMAGALVVLIVVIAVIFVAGGDGGGQAQTTTRNPAASSIPPQAMPTEAVAARPVPADQLEALRPQAVAVGTFDGRLQVTWDPPRSPETVSGYFVIAQTPGTGQIEARHLIERDSELTMVLDDTDVCVVVTTIVSSPEGLQLARGDLVCPPAATTRSPRS